MEMIDLQKISGLPIFFDAKNDNLEFRGDFSEIKKSERSLEELRPYLSPCGKYHEGTKNPDANNFGNQVPNIIYYVWHYVNLKKDGEKLKKANLRYDITFIPAGKIDFEFFKTAGHFHKNKINTEFPYPEIFEVLTGRAHFLIQSPEKDTKNIKAARLIEAGPGEKVLVPPQFSGLTTINAFNEPLIMANWISDQVVYDYDSYKNNRGASYYLLDNNNLIDIVKNPNYNFVPEIQKISAKSINWPAELTSIKDQPIYNLVNNLEILRFLNYPEEFASLEW